MAYEYDRLEREDGGGSFLMGLLAGTVLGAGLGMLFAPKAGAELRNQLNEQAGKLRSTANETLSQVKATANDTLSQAKATATDTLSQVKATANDTYAQATDKVTQIVDKGKDAYDRARNDVGNVSTMPSPAPATGTTGSTAPSGPAGFPPKNPTSRS